MVKFAQIGVGYWGPNLLRNIDKQKDASLEIVVDLSEARREFVKTQYPHIKVSDNIDEVWSDSSIEAVVISTPVATHYDLSIKALESDKHILVEKPMATTLEEMDAIKLLADKHNKIAMVGHTFIYNDAVRYVKKLVDTGELGELRYIYSQRLNLGRIRSDVDALWNLAPHDISIIQYWLNDMTPSGIVRHGVDYIQDGIDDVVFMNIVYPNKVMANVHVSWLDPHKVRCMTIVGSKKMVVYDDMADSKIAIYDKGIETVSELGKEMHFDTPPSPEFSYRSGDVLLPKINFKEPLSVEIGHFIDCIRGEAECLTGIDHARGVVEILSQAK